MRPDRDDRDLLIAQAATIFELTDSSRILHRNSPDHAAGPRLHLAGCASGIVVHIRHDVAEGTARAIEGLVASEPALHDLDSKLVHLDDYVRLLAAEAPVERCDRGMLWTFPERLGYQPPATLVRSDTPAGDRLLARGTDGGMPEAMVALGFVDTGEFWAPWCVALDGDEIASIAFTVGVGPASAEVGVATVPALRGRGLAAAATAGWASLPAHSGRTLFYGAAMTNVSSQRVTQRLGLRPIGATWALT